MVSKKILAATVLATYALSAVPAFAQRNDTALSGTAFCKNIDTVASKIASNMLIRNQKISDHLGDVKDKKAARWSENDAKLNDVRQKNAEMRSASYANLESKAITDRQKSAVAVFKSAMDSAISARHSAIDNAIKAYRAGVDAALQAHDNTLVAAEAAFETSVENAIARAKADCSSGVTAQTVRSTLREAITSAQTTFKQARKDSSLEATRQQLVSTRKSAVDTAVQTFKAAAEKARSDLRAAFKSDSNTQPSNQ